MRFSLFALAMVCFAVQEAALSLRYRLKYRTDEYFVGSRSRQDVQKVMVWGIYLGAAGYVITGVYLTSGFTFWGLISPITLFEHPGLEIFGFAAALVSVALMAWARISLGSSWRVGLDSRSRGDLVTRGLYRYTRNPYFLFLLSFFFSVFLMTPSAVTLFIGILNCLLLRIEAIEEEAFLEKKYGESYLSYRNSTARFLLPMHLK